MLVFIAERGFEMKRISVLVVASLLLCLFVADAAAAKDRIIKKKFEVEDGGRLELDLETGGSLEISGWSNDLVAVEIRIGGRDRDDVDIEFDESRSEIQVRSSFGGRRNRKIDLEFEIMVPERFDISIDSNGGAIGISGIEGRFKGKTLGGAIELANLKGDVRLKTYGGSIKVEDSELDGKVETMGGSIAIEDVVGDLKGSTMGGKVTYRNVKSRSGEDDAVIAMHTMGGDIEADYTGRDVRAKTMGGDIDVSSDEDVHATTMGGDVDVARGKKVEVMTFGGDINVDEAPAGAKVRTMGGDIKIRSAGRFVRATTMGGDIEVDSIDGWVKAKTMGGDVTVAMTGDPDEGERNVEITSMGGDITLEVPKGLSMEFDIELAYTKKKSHKNYKIVSDFDMKIERTDKWKRRLGSPRKYIYGTGEVRGGKHRIKIKTVNGNIYIREG